MRDKHVNEQIKAIRSILSSDGGTMVRKKAFFGASDRQIAIIRRMIKVRHIIESIPDEKALLIFGSGEVLDFLFRVTALNEKNVIGIAVSENASINDMKYCDSYNDARVYSIIQIEEGVKKADIVLMTEFRDWGEGQRKILERLNYKGEILSIYDENDYIPFYCFTKPEERDQYESNMLRRIRDVRFYPADDYDLEMLWRIEKINKRLEICRTGKTLVYGVGGHTDAIFDLTDIGYMNVVAFADRDRRKYFDIEVRSTEPESFADVDHIVISSYIYQNEIKEYLDRIGVGDKAVLLYDESDPWEFYKNRNEYAPDIPYERKNEKKYGPGDVYARVERGLNDLTRNSDYYLTYCMYPDPKDFVGYYYRGEEELYDLKGYEKCNCKTAIVIQGPIIYDDDFTYNTVITYKMRFPQAVIILSTWQNEQIKDGFERFGRLGIEIVLSDAPKSKGILNVNYQCRSTYAGIIRAKELGIPYVIKTRSDFRLYEESILTYLMNLVEKFPSSDADRKRLAILPPVMDVAYYIPDFIVYGSTEDMEQFWDTKCELPGVIPEEYAKDGIVNPEGLLFGRYLKKINRFVDKPAINTKEYIDLLCSEFIVVDYESYKYLWKKYSYESSMPFLEQKNIFTGIDWMSRQLAK